MEKVKVALFWIRREIRLEDNAGLYEACQRAEVVIPFFNFDSRIYMLPDMGAPRLAFITSALKALSEVIAKTGGKLVFRHGDAPTQIAELIRDTHAQALFFNRDYEPYTKVRDEAVTKVAKELGVAVHVCLDGMIHEPEECLRPNGQPWQVFTPYSLLWKRREHQKPYPKVTLTHPEWVKQLRSVEIPKLSEMGKGFTLEVPLIPHDELAAQNLLEDFLDNHLRGYAVERDLPSLDGTSRLSPHLHFGTISARTILHKVQARVLADPSLDKDGDKYIGELIWRDFYRQIFFHFPHCATSAFQAKFNTLKWENNEELFKLWCEGRTGYPIVDAGMRQLNTTGWMHNRVRMVVASFLVKDLLINWQWGETYFMQKLFDGDPPSNNGGWQWSAGVGTDAQPYFRIFNPALQTKRFDRGGAYIERYVPEVNDLRYPGPIVNHAEQKIKALSMFRAC